MAVSKLVGGNQTNPERNQWSSLDHWKPLPSTTRKEASIALVGRYITSGNTPFWFFSTLRMKPALYSMKKRRWNVDLYSFSFYFSSLRGSFWTNCFLKTKTKQKPISDSWRIKLGSKLIEHPLTLRKKHDTMENSTYCCWSGSSALLNHGIDFFTMERVLLLVPFSPKRYACSTALNYVCFLSSNPISISSHNEWICSVHFHASLSLKTLFI